MNILLSCMHQSDFSILERSNINCDAIIINQSIVNEDKIFQWRNQNTQQTHEIHFISTTDRGLSKSRNYALVKAIDDICLISDDDEIFYDNCSDLVIESFKNNPGVDVIAFQIDNTGKRYPKKEKKIGYLGALKLASWQLAFRRKSIVAKNIKFDETLGSGVSKAGGEENKFLYDCIKNGLKIIFVPISIGKMIPNESKWFHGYSREYFIDRGKMTRKLMGSFLASLYGIYYLIFKYSLYRRDIGFRRAALSLSKGIFS